MPTALSPPVVSMLKTSVALYLSGSRALMPAPAVSLVFAFVSLIFEFALVFAFELLFRLVFELVVTLQPPAHTTSANRLNAPAIVGIILSLRIINLCHVRLERCLNLNSLKRGNVQRIARGRDDLE